MVDRESNLRKKAKRIKMIQEGGEEELHKRLNVIENLIRAEKYNGAKIKLLDIIKDPKLFILKKNLKRAQDYLSFCTNPIKGNFERQVFKSRKIPDISSENRNYDFEFFEGSIIILAVKKDLIEDEYQVPVYFDQFHERLDFREESKKIKSCLDSKMDHLFNNINILEIPDFVIDNQPSEIIDSYEIDITDMQDDFLFLLNNFAHPGAYFNFYKFIFFENKKLVMEITERISLVKDKIILIFGLLY